MNNRLRNGAVLVALTLAVAGCVEVGGPTRTPPNSGPDPNVEVRALLNNYVQHTENEDWDKFAGLYTYPFTFVLIQHDQRESTNSSDDLNELYTADELQNTMEALFPDVADGIATKSVEIVHIEEVENEGDINEPVGSSFIFDLVMTFEIANPNSAREFLLTALFGFVPIDVEDRPNIDSVRLTEQIVSTSGGSNIVTAHSEVVFGREGTNVSCIIAGHESFTLVRTGSGWKIEKHEHTMREDTICSM